MIHIASIKNKIELIIDLSQVDAIEKISSQKGYFTYQVAFKSGVIMKVDSVELLNDFKNYLQPKKKLELIK